MLKISDRNFIILIIVISVIAIILAPINAYRLSNEFHRMPVEQLEIYRSFLISGSINQVIQSCRPAGKRGVIKQK